MWHKYNTTITAVVLFAMGYQLIVIDVPDLSAVNTNQFYF